MRLSWVGFGAVLWPGRGCGCGPFGSVFGFRVVALHVWSWWCGRSVKLGSLGMFGFYDCVVRGIVVLPVGMDYYRVCDWKDVYDVCSLIGRRGWCGRVARF